MPSFCKNFNPLYSAGLWLAVMTIPPSYCSFSVINCIVGVVAKSQLSTLTPYLVKESTTHCDISFPDCLPSLPNTQDVIF